MAGEHAKVHSPFELSRAQIKAGAEGLVGASLDGTKLFTPNGEILLPASGAGNTVKMAYRSGAAVGTVIATGADGIGVADGWSVSGGTLSTVVDPSRPGRTILRVTGAPGAASGLAYARRKINAVPLTGKFEAVVKAPQVSVGVAAFWLGFSSAVPGANPPAAAPANNTQMYCDNSEMAMGQWTCVTAHPSQPRYTTGRPSGRTWGRTEAMPSVVNYLELIVQWDASVPDAERVLDIDEVRVNGYAKPCVVYTFDGAGAYANINSYVLPLFKSLGLVGVISGSASTMQANKARIDELYAAGWDVVHQALRSTNNYASNSRDLWADIERAKAIMKANGWTRDGMDVLMTMPSNARNAATDAIAADRGIQMVGATGGLIGHSPLPMPGKLGIGRISLNGATANSGIGGLASNANAALDAAILEGSSAVYFAHDVPAAISSPNETTQMTQSEFSAHVTYAASRIAAGFCENVTLSELNRRT